MYVDARMKICVGDGSLPDNYCGYASDKKYKYLQNMNVNCQDH